MNSVNKSFEIEYDHWKKEQLKNRMYFIIFESFLDEKLNKISGGALKLYVFLGMKSKPYTGSSWYAVETMAKYFGVTERSIINWLNELIELNLIKRIKHEGKITNTTYLLPY